jgi:hypothetical protein
MGLFSNEVDRSKLKVGDHVYTWRDFLGMKYVSMDVQTACKTNNFKLWAMDKSVKSHIFSFLTMY